LVHLLRISRVHVPLNTSVPYSLLFSLHCFPCVRFFLTMFLICSFT
jgi:hypothetical protein